MVKAIISRFSTKSLDNPAANHALPVLVLRPDQRVS